MTILDDILDRIEATRKFYNAPWEGDVSYSLEKAERNAKRKNKKADGAAPLFAFAGLVNHITPEELKRKYDISNQAYAKQLTESENGFAEEASKLVREVAKLVSEDELLELENYRVRVYSNDVVYDCEFWRKKLGELKVNNA